MTRISDGRDAGAFITAALDDFGLDMPCFRIYARIVRRSGTKMGCFESIDNMAKACRMNRDTAYGALKTLLKHRLIEKEPHPGKPSSYYLTPSSEWIPLNTYPKSGDTPPVPNKGIGGIPNEGIGGIPNEGIGGIPNEGIGGIPNEGTRRDQVRNPIKDHHEGGKNAAADDVGRTDPFYTGQVKQIAKEVVKVQRKFEGPKNFITDAPWGRLADELGKSGVSIHKEFEKYLIAIHSDKKDPEAYAGKICRSLWEIPGSELACKPWKKFAEHYRQNQCAPPIEARQPKQAKLVEIPDREASAKAIREARYG